MTKYEAQILSMVLCVVVVIISCQQKGESPERSSSGVNLSIATWLAGSWGSREEDRMLYESWIFHDSMMMGKSYVIRNMDTVSSETVNLVLLRDSIFYMPVVRNQNNGESVKFLLTSYDERTLTFENPSHDFPQIIRYQLINKDSMVAEISGIFNGQHRSELFPMRRLK